MPGIVGKVSAGSAEKTTVDVGIMVQRMRHEPFYESGSYQCDTLRAGFGWVCHKGSFSDGQPYWNEEKNICLFFSGECVGLQETVTPTKANSLLPLYEELGLSFLEKLNGIFSGALLDLRTNRVVLFNDRYGLGRIYYHESPDGFYFASEAKSLLAVLPGLREIEQRSLAEFYSVGCVLQNRSLFKDISLLPGGSQWTFHGDGRIERQRYFDPQAWEQQEQMDARSYTEQLTEVFSRIVPRYLQGPSAVGMSLTGGLDSRMLLAWARVDRGTLPCYTFGGPYRDSADVRIARRLAAIAGQPHTTIQVENNFFPEFSSLAEQTVYLSDGAMDVSGAVELYVNRRAREIAPVRLTGNYGSEILRSNVAFRPGRLNRALFTPEFCHLLDQAEETYRTESAGNRLSFIAFKQVPWHHYPRLAVEQSQLTARSPFLDNDLVALAYRVPRESATSPQPLLELIAAGNSALENVGTDRALTRHGRSLPILNRVARAWQEFTAKAEYAYDYGMPRRLAQIDHRLSMFHLERLFLGRHKFYHFRIWYKQQLKGYLDACRDSFIQPACYRPGAGKLLIQAHLSGRDNHTLELHKLFSVQLIERLFLRTP